MPEPDDAIEWDFVTLAAWWNLYGLPVLLTIVFVVVLTRRRFRPAPGAWRESSQTVRRIGLIHCALAIQALMFLVQELLTIRTMGIPESHVGLAGGLISTVVNPVLAIGILRRWSLARRLAIAWYAILSLLAILIVAWRCYYQVAFDPATWPVLAVSRIMPVFLFVVMLLARIKQVFAKGARSGPLSAETGNPEETVAVTEAPVRWPLVSLSTLLFLIIAGSNLIVDGADWGYRLVFEPELVP